MDLVLILDTETTALDPEHGTCIELAIVGYSIAHAAVTEAHSWLIQSEGNEAERINHIPAGLLQPPAAHAPGYVWQTAECVAEKYDAILAHNADFDRQWPPAAWFFGLTEPPWIDTCHGIEWPKQTKPGESLISLCLAHGLAVVDPHRALSDCLLLARLLTRCAELGHNLETILAMGLRPMAEYQALVPYERRQEAKDLGFHWEPNPKRWTRKMATADVDTLPFAVRKVK